MARVRTHMAAKSSGWGPSRRSSRLSRLLAIEKRILVIRFMFRLTKAEAEALRSQFVISRSGSWSSEVAR